MFIKPSHLPVLSASGPSGKVDTKHNWHLHATSPCVHILIGVVCAAMALPLGLRAAALAPIAICCAKGIFDHYAKDDADPVNFAWMIAGAALVVASGKLSGWA